MSVQTDPIPPVPEHTPPLREDGIGFKIGKLLNPAWTRWLGILREKINVISESLVNLGDVSGTGILTKNGEVWVARELKGTSGEITVTNGTGDAGDPTIELDNSGVSAGTTLAGIAAPALTVDSKGRITGTTAVDYTISATAGASISGYIKITVKLGGTPTEVYIPYYPAP